MSKLALRAQAADIANLPLRQGLLAKKRFNDRSKEFLFGQQPVNWPPTSVPSRSVKDLLINASGCASMANYLYPA